jgi:D-alanyl-D-alanine carboxypeptidase
MMAVSSTLHKKKDDKITITPKSIEDGYDLGLKNKQVWDLSELLKYTLVFSSNDGAEAVADSFGGKDIFVAQMNNDAKNLGLNLTFTDPAGRDLGGKIGGKGTVLEVAKLFSIARKNIPEILDATTKKRETVVANSGKISGIPNTNQDIETLSGAEASKTGYTDMAGGNLGVVVDVSVGHPIVIVVLGSTRTGRFEDMDTLYKALRVSISKEDVPK